MKRSTHHILTTHTGSLPRPSDLVDMVLRKEAKHPVDEEVLAMRVRSAVAEAVRRQAEVGITVLNDGEQGKPGYSTYMKDRLTGFEGEITVAAVSGEAKDFPEYTARRTGRASPMRPACTGPIAWKDRDAVRKDIENLKAAVKEVKAEEVFMTAASPGVVPHFMKDQYYGSEEKYLYALADALKEEYDAIHHAGFVLQVDCPDLCMSRHNRFSDLSTKEFKKIAELHVAALNHALRDIPADRVRLHMCWGNYEGPHHLDIPLREIIDVALKAKVGALSFEAPTPDTSTSGSSSRSFISPMAWPSFQVSLTPRLISSSIPSLSRSELSATPRSWAARTSSRAQTVASVPSCAQNRPSTRASRGPSSSRSPTARPLPQSNFGTSGHLRSRDRIGFASFTVDSECGRSLFAGLVDCDLSGRVRGWRPALRSPATRPCRSVRRGRRRRART
jgi:5-methyltetrahydropteroyltriglutamate--homocysteine methyltransferase